MGKPVSTRRNLYNRWYLMHKRCEDPTDARFGHYGGRGIRVSLEWSDFQTFFDWAVQSGFQPELQLDRINNDGGYTPANCRWATRSENAGNRRWTDAAKIALARSRSKINLPDALNAAHKAASKPVRCVETGEVFESARFASRKIGASLALVTHVLKGRCNTAKGYHWEYA